MLPAVFLKKQ